MIKSVYTMLATYAVLILVACNNSASHEEGKTDTAAAAKNITVDSAVLGLSGIYYGYVPCADCPGISTYLLLNPDMTYRLEETYNKKSDELFLTSGTWKLEGGKITLTHDGKTGNSYMPESEKLWQLDHQGNRISGNLGDKYVLNRQPVAENKHLKAKADEGIDFIANGNEPFWSLEIDRGNNFIFNRPGLEKPDTIVYAAPTVNKGVREYHVQSGDTQMDLKIMPQFCSDGMSDFVYEFRVELNYNKKKYSGCGRMLNALE